MDILEGESIISGSTSDSEEQSGSSESSFINADLSGVEKNCFFNLPPQLALSYERPPIQEVKQGYFIINPTGENPLNKIFPKTSPFQLRATRKPETWIVNDPPSRTVLLPDVKGELVRFGMYNLLSTIHHFLNFLTESTKSKLTLSVVQIAKLHVDDYLDLHFAGEKDVNNWKPHITSYWIRNWNIYNITEQRRIKKTALRKQNPIYMKLLPGMYYNARYNLITDLGGMELEIFRLIPERERKFQTSEEILKKSLIGFKTSSRKNALRAVDIMFENN
jgi:hypothetical protein